jgi:thiamine-phosphate pyrophosphorylase
VPAPDFNLYLITDRSETRGRDLLWVLERALDGGVKAVQLREKNLSGKALYYLAEKSKALCRRYHARLFINDRVDVALAVEADGVQLGKTSLPVETARALIGTDKLIGYSTHALAEAQQAEQSGADFVLFGPVYFTPSKASFGSPQGLAPLKELVAKISLPVYAIGGIKPESIADLECVGIRGVALISAVIGATDPKDASLTLLQLLRKLPSG